uniref:Chloride channel protein n=1 Tax=Zooxanthella nutricula TaxID=1333877 RepID=A0A7S2LST8_9DINO
MPACMAASLFGVIFGDSLWRPDKLLGHSMLVFPGGPPLQEGGVQATSPNLSLPALLWGGPIGCAASLLVHILILAVKKLHPVAHRLRHGRSGEALRPWVLRWRRAGLLALAGAINGAFGMLYPGALFWGEEEMQLALTQGCSEWRANMTECSPAEMPFLYAGLTGAREDAPAAIAPYSSGHMLGIALVKLVMILICELAGFAGGAIYPVAFSMAAFGSALGAQAGVAAMGSQYIAVCGITPIACGLAALLNTPFFAIFFVLVLQVNIPHGTASAQLMTMLFAVSLHYLIMRPWHHIFPELNMIATQQPRWDMKYILPPWDTPPKHEEESDAPPRVMPEQTFHEPGMELYCQKSDVSSGESDSEEEDAEDTSATPLSRKVAGADDTLAAGEGAELEEAARRAAA